MDRRPRVNPDPRSLLPSVGELLAELSDLHGELPEWALKRGIQRAVEELRMRVATGAEALDQVGEHDRESLRREAAALSAAYAQRAARVSPRPVLNATGVVLHTNLGRAPLAEGAARAALAAAAGYSNLELDLETGKRGNRIAAVADKLVQLSGAPAAYACNNNAAAVLLALDTLARGREVIVSRGELVEIGGSFRVPDIMARAGVKLVEVGTTNRTHPRDYADAIGPQTALLLKVHRSNFEQRGFTAEVGLGELAEIARPHGLPVVEDLGSGTLIDLRAHGLPAESFATPRLAMGAGVVCFSGDKLLGGPQAGLLLGSEAAIAAMKSNPLARALRLDKMSLAALDWTLGAILGGRADREIPVLRALLADPATLAERAEALARQLRAVVDTSAIDIAVESGRAPVGGGSLPGLELEGSVVALRGARSASDFAAALRQGEPPLIVRVRDEALLLDVRTLDDGDFPALCGAIKDGLAGL